jgi:hypothetical protein
MKITGNYAPQYVSNYKKPIKQDKTGDKFGDILLQKSKENEPVKSPAKNTTANVKVDLTAAAYEAARAAFTPTASCPYPHCNPKVLTYVQAKAFQAVDPSAVIIMDTQNTGWWVVVEPGDPLYGLSGDELFNAIVRKHDGGRNHYSSDWGFMLNELRANGFITAEEVDALDLVRLHMEGHARWREEQRLGADFNLDLFIANLRFSFFDYLDVLEELSEGIPNIAEHKDFIKNFEDRIATS